MNDISSVPGRIVIVGTSKMKLSDRFFFCFIILLIFIIRFSRIGEANSRRLKNKKNFYGLASDNMITRSFLYDDYMSNDLFDSDEPEYLNIKNNSKTQNKLFYVLNFLKNNL